jgi:hypothetical protein
VSGFRPNKKSDHANIVGQLWELPMPIYRLLERETFRAETTAMLGHVFEDVLKELRLVSRQDPVTELIAEELIELANTGERDPVRLKQQTPDAFRGDGPT